MYTLFALLAAMALQVPLALGDMIASGTPRPGIFDLSASKWTLSNPAMDISIPASFPSYAHVDLYASQVIGNPEYGLNDFNLRWIWKQNWTYTTNIPDMYVDGAMCYHEAVVTATDHRQIPRL